MRQDGFHDMGVVGDAELIGHGQEQGVCFRNRLVLGKLTDKSIGLRRVTAAKNRPGVLSSMKPIVSASLLPWPK